MAYTQGAIVLVDNPFGNGRRPVLVISNDERPFQGKQYTIAIVTTTDRTEAVRSIAMISPTAISLSIRVS